MLIDLLSPLNAKLQNLLFLASERAITSGSCLVRLKKALRLDCFFCVEGSYVRGKDLKLVRSDGRSFNFRTALAKLGLP